MVYLLTKRNFCNFKYKNLYRNDTYTDFYIHFKEEILL